MYSVVQNFMTRLSVIIPLLMTVILTRIRAEECGHEELAQCARPLQVLSATSELSFVTKKEELEKLCPDLYTGLRCIHSYTRRCMSAAQRSHFNKLYHGTNSVIKELCMDGPYQEEFLRHAPCMREVKAEYEICARRYQNTMSEIGKPKNQTTPSPPIRHAHSLEPHQHNEHEEGHYHQQQQQQPIESHDEVEAEERVKTVCCAFQEYMDCSQHTVKRRCGEETALFTKGFLDKMSSSLIKLHCTEYGHGSGRCVGFSGATVVSSTSLWAALVFALVPLLVAR